MMFKYIILAILIIASAVASDTGVKGSATYLLTEVESTVFAKEIDTWVNLGEETEVFRSLIAALALPTDLQTTDWRSLSGTKGIAICTICKGILKVFIAQRRKGVSADIIKHYVIKLCTLLNLQNEGVCKGVVNLHAPVILHIIDSKLNLTSSTICGVLLESQSCPLNDDEYEWKINIDNNSPKLIPLEKLNKTIEVVQITDIHYDPKYEPYGNPHCGEPTCCRKGQNKTNVKGEVAGYWGDYNDCDTPWHTVTNTLDHVKATHQNIAYVYFTGDVVDHGVWETSRTGNIESINKFYRKLYETFKGIPVYPILGNHEPHPLNQYAPKDIENDELSTQWLFSLMADLWINFGWLPESTRSSIMLGGFYTVVPRKGFRIIALNSNVCYCYNWWLLYQPQDPYNQLQWLANTLLQAEQNKEFVHILAHVPPGDKECQFTWRREYTKIINRFAHVIGAQFNGHSHNDELHIFFESNDVSKANNIAWNGGSATTYTNLNSNYKIYSIEADTFRVQDFENWIFNLTLANEDFNSGPYWFKSYSFKKEYNLSDLSANSLHKWLKAMANDKNTLKQYYRNFFKDAEPALKTPCNAKCMKKYLCRIIIDVTKQQTLCNSISNT